MPGVTGYGKGLQSDAVATVLGQQYTLTVDLGNACSIRHIHAERSYATAAPFRCSAQYAERPRADGLGKPIPNLGG